MRKVKGSVGWGGVGWGEGVGGVGWVERREVRGDEENGETFPGKGGGWVGGVTMDAERIYDQIGARGGSKSGCHACLDIIEVGIGEK